MTGPSDDDRHLVRRALDGEPDALRALVATLLPVVRSRTARVLGRYRGQAEGRDLSADLDDVSQEAFARLWADRGAPLRSWDPARGLSLRNFVGLLAEQNALQILRSRRRNPWTDQPNAPEDLPVASSPGPEARLAAAQQLDVLLDRLRASLSPRGLEVFELLLVQRLEVEEVCARTGMSRDAVYAWRSRIKKTMVQLRDEPTALPGAAHAG